MSLTDGRKNVNFVNKICRPMVESAKEENMTDADFFAEIKGKFLEADISGVQEHLAFQFNIIGEGSGIFYVEAKEGQLSIEPYEYFDRDAMFTATGEIFMKIAEGKLDPVMAFTMQKLKVEGNIEKALKLKDLIDRK